MKYLFLFIVFALNNGLVVAQNKIEQTLKQLNTASVPYIYYTELQNSNEFVLLDARKKEEYEISHLKNAIWVGYTSFQKDLVLQQVKDKNTPIIVYCSIGVRSEDIGEKLLKAGYTNVKNLYGGIFLWKNEGNTVYSVNAIETDSVHAYDKQWGKLLTKGVKVYSSEKQN